MILLPVALLALVPPAQDPALADLEVVRGRTVERLLAQHASALSQVPAWLATLGDDGAWPDVDYADRNRSAWPTAQHLDRLVALARARVEDPGAPELAAAAHRALGYWLEHDFENPNWWHNRIGVPRKLYRALLLFADDLDVSERERGLAILARAGLGMTGQNRVWVADITLARACLEADPELAARAVESMASTLTTGGEEGIQPDLSFFQHGQCLYSGGYGLGFSVDLARAAALVRGTALAFTPEQVELLSRYVLDGQQWMMRGDLFDHGTVGREITRRGRNGAAIADACDDLALLGTPRRAELEVLARRVRGQALPGDPVLDGNRHFFRGELMVHRRPGFLISVRTCSERVESTDGPANREGLLSHTISDGATFVYRDADEYRDLFGGWDWRHVPGTTVELKPLAKNPRRRGAGSFAGGASDGSCGVTTFDLTVGALAARKAWFCFDDEVLCAGAGVACDSEHGVITAVDQCRLRGPVTAARAGEGVAELPRGSHALAGVRWVHHHGVGYLFAGEPALHLEAVTRESDWSRANERYPPTGETVDVLDLWLDHGARPAGASHAYTLLPDASADEVAARAADPRTVLLANTPAVQAAWHRPSGRLGLVLRGAGEVAVPAALHGLDDRPLHVSADGPALLLLRFAGGRVQVHSADPNAAQSTLRVTVDRPLPGPWDRVGTVSSLELAHPGAPRRGATVASG